MTCIWTILSMTKKSNFHCNYSFRVSITCVYGNSGRRTGCFALVPNNYRHGMVVIYSKENQKIGQIEFKDMKKKNLFRILFSVTIILLVPLVAMQFTKEVNWDILDFALMGVLLTSAYFICELVWRKVKNIKSRIIICATILFVLVLFWIELAVGIFGTPLAGY